MPRRGLLSRVLDWLGERTRPGRSTPPETPPPAPPPGPPPPPPPDERPPGGGGGGANPFRTEFNATVPSGQIRRIQEATGFSRNEIFQAHIELFYSLHGIVDEERSEQLYLWSVYLDHMVATTERRNDPDNPFWREFGIDPRTNAFDWGEWRSAMGYRRRK